ncbi:MAG: SulP family inorganic anion transporter [Anaerolineae bacterium]|nr:SulP family inorganic anion transporter [Candidatus Roseilinea sp.]MDW8451480.1 SulP family inorganic anion transporter [Anaerolineae bacterium]
MTTINAPLSQGHPAQKKLRPPTFLRGIRGVREVPKEIIAGVTLAALMIPLNIGYAQVAGLPPVVGLYAAIAPMIAFALFSTSRNLVASPDAPIAALIGGLLASLAAPDDPRYVQLAFGLALLCALIFFLFWLFRLGFLANFLSRAVLIGFITGLGIEVFTSQLKKIMGVSLEAEGYFREVIELIRKIPEANLYAVAIGVGSVAIIRLLKRYAPRLPGALIALVLMTAVVAIFNLDARGVSVLGAVPSGLPTPVWPQLALGDYVKLLPGALAICGVTLAEGLLIGRKYAQKYGDKLDADQEMFAFGAANAAAGLTGAFVVGSSASRTAAMDGAGARSQLPSLVAAGVVAILLLFFSPLLALLPNAALGGIVANAVLSLIEVGELKELFHQRRSEFFIAIVALLSVLVLGALPAVVIAFLLSTIVVVGSASKPHTAVLQVQPDAQGALVEAAAQSHPSSTLPGLIVYRFSSSLYFANANAFTEEVEHLIEDVEAQGEKVRWFVLDAEAINDVDTTGAEALRVAHDYLSKRGIVFALARANPIVIGFLETYELDEAIPESRRFATNRQAIEAYSRATDAGS